MKKGVLTVEGLGRFEGELLGKETQASGEIVFSTSPSGYIKSITDPSYRGQILVFSFPYIGSYGLNEDGESDDIQVNGVVINNIPPLFREKISKFFESKGIPCIILRETRSIVDFIRKNGNRIGVIGEIKAENPYKRNLVDEVAIRNLYYEKENSRKLLLVDLGLKGNILKFLDDFSIKITDYKRFSSDDIDKFDGIVITNGPGDPAHEGLLHFRGEVRKIMGSIPILGICLGHQIIALASGMKTTKMKFGHRSINHPVLDKKSGKIGITTHNHGFTVLFEEGHGLEMRYISMNDYSNEGMEGEKVLTTQFHPEGGPGPRDELGIFNEFRRMIDNER